MIGRPIIVAMKANFLQDWIKLLFPHHPLVEVKVLPMQAYIRGNQPIVLQFVV
jgi:hypothetical protein